MLEAKSIVDSTGSTNVFTGTDQIEKVLNVKQKGSVESVQLRVKYKIIKIYISLLPFL